MNKEMTTCNGMHVVISLIYPHHIMDKKLFFMKILKNIFNLIVCDIL